ncbi:rhomboid-like protein [Streptomyces sp. NPDC092296]|uniref:rhomboid-like protein n=1 Tax=Streptomyces sp. NPDC092296 TaxID=3366012 RepID=UPI003827E5D4
MAESRQSPLRPLGGAGRLHRLRRAVRRCGSPLRALRVLPGPRRTPFTFWYLVVLLGTALYARFGDPESVRAAVAGSSSDGWHLLHTPLRVLALSALWVAGPLWSPYLVAFTATLAPLERRIGPLRTAQVFAIGHVIATLISELPIALGVLAGLLAPGELHRIDVGVSYGVLTCLGAVAGLLPRRLRVAVPLGAAAVLVHQVFTGDDPVTAVGHPVSLLVGLVCWPWVRRWAAARVPERGPGGATRCPELSPAGPARS